MADVNEQVGSSAQLSCDFLTNKPQFDGFEMTIGNNHQALEDLDTVMHLHSNKLGAICLDLWEAREQLEA